MSNNPAISVVMPVYNAERFIAKAIESILKQTFKDFEFIIVDDGSMDGTEKIVRSYQDQRIVYIKNDENLGLPKSLNLGIRSARGEHIARMDADDVSVPERFAQQISFFNNHPEVSIVGSSAILIDKNGHYLNKHMRPKSHIEIKWASLFSTPIIHPTVMANARVLKENSYNETISNSEDYELWSRLLFATDIKFANLPEPLLFYRVFGDSFTQKLDVGKRVVSADNSIRNIEHYTKLSEKERGAIILLRQDQPLSSSQLFLIWNLYLRAARNFSSMEKLGFPKKVRIYSKLISLYLFLAKHKIKPWIK